MRACLSFVAVVVKLELLDVSSTTGGAGFTVLFLAVVAVGAFTCGTTGISDPSSVTATALDDAVDATFGAFAVDALAREVVVLGPKADIAAV